METNQSSSLSRLNRLDPDDGLSTIPWSADADLSHPANTRAPADAASTPGDPAAVGGENSAHANAELPPEAESLPHKFPKPTTLPGMWDLSDY